MSVPGPKPDPNELRSVEVHHAYLWICDDCGRDNFCRNEVAPAAVQDALNERAREQFGVDPEDLAGGSWTAPPDVVTCAHCGGVFTTLADPDEDESAEEDGCETQ